jgi:uncharacterized protein (DUF58 family)
LSGEPHVIPDGTAGELGDRERDLLQRLERVAAVARKRVSGEIGYSAAQRPSPGQGTLFSDHRRFTAGDDLRFVDWNAYARFDELFLRVFEPEDSAPITIFLDASASMRTAGNAKFETAAHIAAAFGAIGMLVLAGARIVRIPSGDDATFQGKSSLLSMLRFVERPPGGRAAGPALAEAVRQAAARARRGPFVFITDAAPPRDIETALRARGRHPAMVFHVVHPAEAEPPERGFVQFTDPESGSTLTAAVTPRLRKRYAELVRERFQEVERAVLAARASFVRVSTQTPFDAAVVASLHRGVLPASA